MTGGSSFEVHLEHGAAAIAAGLCDVVVSVYAATLAATANAARRSGRHGLAGPNPMAQWEWPFGLRMPMGPYALAAGRHMHEFGTTPEQLAQIAVSTHKWATMNQRARYQTPITIDDVLSSPPQNSPLHLLDCCLVTDGAGAFVMTSAERARSLRRPPIYVLGAATCHDHLMITEMPDLTVTPGAVGGPAHVRASGDYPDDVDVLMGYDSFTITALLHLEDLGFCAKGEGGPFAADGRLGPGGSLPMNTNGGGLSYTHPGMYGMFLIVEAVRQLHGEAGARQVARRTDCGGPRLGHRALVHLDRRARHRGHAVTVSAEGAHRGEHLRLEPPVGAHSEAFWEATRRGALLVQWCTNCERAIFYPRSFCPSSAQASGLEWRTASGMRPRLHDDDRAQSGRCRFEVLARRTLCRGPGRAR